MNSSKKLPKKLEGSSVRSRYVITRNSIQANHKNKRQLAFEENRLRYDLQQLVKENVGEKYSIGKHRVSLTVKLASVLWKANKGDDAEKLLRSLLIECTNKLEENHPDTLLTSLHLSSVLRRQNKLRQAKGLCNWALRVNIQKYGPHHTRTILSVNVMAKILKEYSIINQQCYLKEEEKLLRWALQGAHINFGMNHPSTFFAVAHLSEFCWRYGKFDDAETLLRHSLSSIPELSAIRYHPVVLYLVRDLITLLERKIEKYTIESQKHTLEGHDGIITASKIQDEKELINLKSWEENRSKMENIRLAEKFKKWEVENSVQFERFYKSQE
eukprot:g10308.t1